MLGRAGALLTTEPGSWVVLVFTLAVCCVAWWSVDLSTYILSLEAIVLAQAVLAHQGQTEGRDMKRDEAMHCKLDSLLRGVDKADERLAGIEED